MSKELINNPVAELQYARGKVAGEELDREAGVKLAGPCRQWQGFGIVFFFFPLSQVRSH